MIVLIGDKKSFDSLLKIKNEIENKLTEHSLLKIKNEMDKIPEPYHSDLVDFALDNINIATLDEPPTLPLFDAANNSTKKVGIIHKICKHQIHFIRQLVFSQWFSILLYLINIIMIVIFLQMIYHKYNKQIIQFLF